MSRALVAVLEANRLMATPEEAMAFDAAVQAMPLDAALARDLLLVFTDRTEHHEVMWGLLHLVEALEPRAQLAALIDVLPAMLADADEWAHILHYRILNHEPSRRLYAELLAEAAGSPGAAAVRALLAEIAADEDPGLRAHAREVLGEKYPQLETILAAIAERKTTGTITARCPACRDVLAVAEAPGRLVVSCTCGHCRYSQRTRIP